ncbi:MAG: prepilin-type N-terminal cleavage/methylation domain-containing protein [Pseudohongiella sp.]|nr:prepilin-type N-terminal cleavage/methylation domain-containing protein [Pseudohongiella sp.]
MRQSGFTLLEIMVVVLIMGLIAGLVSVVVAPDQRGLLNVESQRLAQLLDLATAQARVSGTSMAWFADASGYGFEQLTPDRAWQAVTDNDALRTRQLPAGVSISGLLLENNPVTEDMRVEFPAYGQTSAFTVFLSNGLAHSEVSVSPVGIVNVVVLSGADNATR